MDRPSGPLGQCQAVVRRFGVHARLVRRSNDRAARLIDAHRYRQAALALRSAASRYGDAWAGDALGHLYAAGLGVPRSAGAAFHWYLWAARRGDRFAQRQVANAYLDAQGTVRDPAAAAYWFRIGIAPWQLAAMYHGLSQTYTRGRLVPANRSKAAFYREKSLVELRRLATQPNGAAAYLLGLAYERGQGVARDRTKALAYLCRAASLQYAPAVAAIRKLEGASR